MIESSEKYYEQASQEYAKLIKSSDDINSAKSAEMNAKYAECKAVLGKISWQDAANEWKKVTHTKPSYKAYGYAKEMECEAKAGTGSWGSAEKAWEIVKEDEDLKNSFSLDCWKAYQKYAQAYIVTYRYIQGKSNWVKVSEAWYLAAQGDAMIVKNSLCFAGFAKEAFMRSKDERMIEKIKFGKV